MADYKYKRVTLFAGHYGSGKTNLAVNFALKMQKSGRNVKIADLDIVNPYFRTKDSAKVLNDAGIELISPAFANTNLDLPALPAEVYSLVFNAVDVFETEFRHTALQRHLTTLETDFSFVTGTRFSAFVTAGRSAAFAGALTATNAFAALIRADSWF